MKPFPTLDDFTQASRASPPSSPGKVPGRKLGPVANYEAGTLTRAEMNLGLRLERLFEDAFRRWGTYVATNPIFVMSVSLVISFGLAFGLSWWKVTTDPVDLWVSSESRARQDMEYFNQHFHKFYRIQQIVIAPADDSSFNATYKSLTGSGDNTETFGPAFNKDFLMQAFRLQQQVEKLVVQDGNKNVTLDSICFKPLEKECATQSVFTYFLDEERNILAEDYIRRVAVCTR